jgi:hypothetical protein
MLRIWLTAAPYQPWAFEKLKKLRARRGIDDPSGRCYLPGVPRVFGASIHTDALHVVERFTRADFNTILYDVDIPRRSPNPSTRPALISRCSPENASGSTNASKTMKTWFVTRNS